jgi:phosphoglycerate dehydrogenase-like enzyme
VPSLRRMPVTVLVIADPEDDTLARLPPASDGVRFVVARDLPGFEPHLADAEAILLWSHDARVLQALVPRAPLLRWVHTWSAGVDKVLFPGLVDSPLVLTNARGVYSPSLAEFAIGAMLYFAKDFPRMKASQARGAWEPFDVQMLRGATLGLVGYGDIGRTVAALGRAFGMELLALRRHAHKSEGDPLAAELAASARDVCVRADYLVVSAPITPETRHLIGAPEIAAMKRAAVLVNIGRGAVVDEAALVASLQRDAIRGAALDVFEREPLPPDHPLFALPNVLLSPHTADHTPTWRHEAMDCFLANLRRFLAGEPLANVVAKAGGY